MIYPFWKSRRKGGLEYLVDIHSHLIPAIDDGVGTVGEAIEIIKGFEALGVKKIITTPHVMGDFYLNTPGNINEGLEELRVAMDENNISVHLEAAAEYYLDDHFVTLIEKEELLYFGDKLVLFETAFMNEPIQLKEVVFKLTSRGYTPVLAHPERYLYLHEKFELLRDIANMGVKLQLNVNSLTGYYSKPVKKMAEKILQAGLVSFFGSDCHNMRHFEVFKAFMEKNRFPYIEKQSILNNTLIKQ